jgi:hypothetical protein
MKWKQLHWSLLKIGHIVECFQDQVRENLSEYSSTIKIYCTDFQPGDLLESHGKLSNNMKGPTQTTLSTNLWRWVPGISKFPRRIE